MIKDKILKKETSKETQAAMLKPGLSKSSHWYYTIPGLLVFMTVVFSLFAHSYNTNLTGLTSEVIERGSGEYSVLLADIDGETYSLDIADTSELRTLGLSGRKSLVPNTGMIFLFDTSAQHGIWMKDMNFSIDILWVNKDSTVVHAQTNVPPDTFPTVFRPPAFSDYVIELPAGTWTEDSVISW